MNKHYTALRYRTHESELELDRSYSDSRIAMVHKRSCKVKDNGGKLKLRVVLTVLVQRFLQTMVSK